MPFTAQQLIEGHSEPVTITVNDSAQKALDLMIEHNYSQLPVIDKSDAPVGMVTSDSLISALNNFGVTTSALPVSAAVVKADKILPDEDLFDLLDRLQDTFAILVVNGEDKLIGIVTSFDITSYFRRRAEDMMILEDIEGALKDHIMASFVDRETGEVRRAAYEAAIKEVGSPSRANKGRFQSALRRYLELSSTTDAALNKAWSDEAFSLLGENNSPSSFDELTLNQYIDLLLHKGRWEQYGALVFDMEPDAIRRLLDDVRQTRNALAHFRGEVSPRQRAQLRFCKDWLNRHPPDLPIAAMLHGTENVPGNGEAGQQHDLVSAVLQDELVSPNDSRYAPLALWLQGQPIDQDRVTLTFEQIEGIINSPLPLSARQHRSWWANDATSHVQSQQWLEVSWRVAGISMSEERVTFVRIRERERAYIDFFSALLSDLNKVMPFKDRVPSPDGQSWITVTWLPEGKLLLPLAFAFSRGARFRVELYIDTGDKTQNKFIFDTLHNRLGDIEVAAGTALSWERLDDKRASRIALYYLDVSIDESKAMLHLRQWAVDAMVRFSHALNSPVAEAVKTMPPKSAL